MRLEEEFREARERLLRVVPEGGKRLAGAIRERELADAVAMAIARAKQHQQEHAEESREKGVVAR